jgi:hypothetical protein
MLQDIIQSILDVCSPVAFTHTHEILIELHVSDACVHLQCWHIYVLIALVLKPRIMVILISQLI